MSGKLLIIPIYYIILTICIGISSVLSYYGLLSSLQQMTPWFVIVISLGLFAAGTLLKSGRDNRSVPQQLMALGLFLIFAFFSTSSNFNRIYTSRVDNQLKSNAFREEFNKFTETVRLVKSELNVNTEEDRRYYERIAARYKEIIDSDISGLKSCLQSSDFLLSQKKIKDTVMEELLQMRTQATDDQNPGCGRLCKEHKAIIDALVPTTDTVLPIGGSPGEINSTIDNYEQKIMESFCTSSNFLALHTINGIVQKSQSGDSCANVDVGFIEKFGSNRLENLRTKTQLKDSFTVPSLEEYLNTLHDVAKKLEIITKDVEVLDVSLRDLGCGSISVYPRKIDDAAVLVAGQSGSDAKDNTAVRVDRERFVELLKSDDFLLIEVKLVSQDQGQSFLLNGDLNEQDVIQKGEPLRFFLEAVRRKQDEIIGRYSETALKPNVEQFARVDIANGEIGEIDETFKNAFIDKKYPSDTVFALILGITFDIVPIIFAFVAFHGKDEDDEDAGEDYNPIT